jgi:gliding motility-associated-like protein
MRTNYVLFLLLFASFIRLSAQNCTSFLKFYDDPSIDAFQKESGTAITMLGTTSLIAAAKVANKTVINRINLEGKITSSLTYDFLANNQETVTELKIQNGKLIGCGFQGREDYSHLQAFAFRIDLATNKVEALTTVENCYFFNIHPLDNGQYAATCCFKASAASLSEAFLMILDSNLKIISNKKWSYEDTGTDDDFTASAVANNILYTSGRNTFGGSNDLMRQVISKLDMTNGDIVFQKALYKPTSVSARMYSYDMIVSDNQLVSTAFGSLNNADAFTESVYLAICGLDGTQQKGIQYTNSILARLDATGLIAVSDGYLISGGDRVEDKSYIFKINKNLDVQWGRLIENIHFGEHQYLTTDADGFIYLYGSTNFNRSQILIKMDASGNIDTPCAEITPLDFTKTTLAFSQFDATLVKKTSSTATATPTVPASKSTQIDTKEQCACKIICNLETNIDSTIIHLFKGETKEITTTTKKAIGTVTYFWTPTTNISCTNCANPNVSPTATTTYVLTVKDSVGCIVKDSVTIIVKIPECTLKMMIDSSAIHLFKGETKKITTTIQKPIGTVTYSWIPTTNISCTNCANPNVSPTATTTYILTVKDSLDCIVKDSVTILIKIPTCTLEANIDSSIIHLIKGETKTVNTLVKKPIGSVTYNWTPTTAISCTDCPNPSLSPSENTLYIVTVKDSLGCIVKDSVNVLVEIPRCEQKSYVPNVFAPEGTKDNSYFGVVSVNNCVKKIQLLEVYSRWGELIFRAEDFLPNDVRGNWDGTFRGKPCGSDVFVYHVTLELTDGTSKNLKGDVTLIR